MKTRFFTTLEANLENAHGAIWELERWHDDVAWRLEFLAKLGLDRDISPSMVGLGSSFSYSRALSSGAQMRQRFEMVEPWDAWVTFIQKAASEHPEVFSAKERIAIETLERNRMQCTAPIRVTEPDAQQ